ncbi:nucleoside 2-deoxyribosyltransferase [Bittarella massiliensis (ex Durand et al. 2017)]|uniref:Nucleoside 2-deoxyribosyltransferase n=1 Tax=Bittarella massiliensis (ex Durand et al. 2017) TaxID=1720313 RepID=A0AAW5KDY9_9FIRM|nr:nucleoside 2-deoxyribosyltransferase [Bittarella massiliensis (ex Durand et al. 2017)]MCQ4949184.1 nucleoside 2-deoxyribosyltransferase [Bittarella massiliensis (ex Durand et al. 2017)]
MRRPRLYITGPQCFYPGGEHQLLTMKYLAEEYGFEVTNIKEKMGFDDCDPATGRQPLRKLTPDYLDDCDIVVGDVNFFRGGEPESGTIFELGVGFARGKKLYSFTRDRRDVIHRYPVGQLCPDGKILDEHGMGYATAHTAGNLMYMVPSKIVEGDFEACLKTIVMDLIEEAKDRGQRIVPRQDLRAKSTWPLGELPRAYLAGFECFLLNAREVGDRMKAFALDHGVEGIFPPDEAPGLKEPEDMSDVYTRSAFYFDRDQLHIRNSNMVIANLNPYHGHEPDSGTVFESGMSFGLGYRCYCFLSDGRELIEKVPCNLGEDGIYRDIEGYRVENCGQPLASIIASNMTVVVGGFKDAILKVEEDTERLKRGE